MKIHRMPNRMSPITLQRKDKSITLRAGRIPKLDGKPVELTPKELTQLRRSGIVPVEQSAPRPFKIKAKTEPQPAPAPKPKVTSIARVPRSEEPKTEKSAPLAKIKVKKVPKSEAL